MAKKPIILLDFDETLISTVEIKRRLSELASKAGADEAEAMSILIAFRPFRREKYDELRRSSNPRIRKFLKDLPHLFASPRAYNFPGVANFLRILSSRYIVFLFTYGDKRLQSQKIRQSELRQFFDRVVVTGDPTKEKLIAKLARQYRNRIALVDDAPTVCAIARAHGMPVIAIKKGEKDAAYYRTILARLENLFES